MNKRPFSFPFGTFSIPNLDAETLDHVKNSILLVVSNLEGFKGFDDGGLMAELEV